MHIHIKCHGSHQMGEGLIHWWAGLPYRGSLTRWSIEPAGTLWNSTDECTVLHPGYLGQVIPLIGTNWETSSCAASLQKWTWVSLWRAQPPRQEENVLFHFVLFYPYLALMKLCLEYCVQPWLLQNKRECRRVLLNGWVDGFAMLPEKLRGNLTV